MFVYMCCLVSRIQIQSGVDYLVFICEHGRPAMVLSCQEHEVLGAHAKYSQMWRFGILILITLLDAFRSLP
jgi:hypothetical protein